jgi:hypothetical protein
MRLGPIFARKAFDAIRAGAFAAKHCSIFDFSTSPPPSSRSFSLFLQRVQHSAPGIDGIPYAAYAKSEEISSKIFYDISVWLCSGQQMLLDYNDTLNCLFPKAKKSMTNERLFGL